MSTLIQHSRIGDGHIHTIVNWTFDTYPDLLAFTNVTNADLGKICKVVDMGAGTGAYYILEKIDYLTGVRTWTSIFGGAGSGGATNLTASYTPTTFTVVSDTGTDAIISAADATNAGAMTSAMQVKLAGVAPGATANSSDATLLARANHTGAQLASTISDFTEAAQDAAAALLVAGTNVTLNYNDAANTLTINATGGGGGGATNLSLANSTSTTLDINSDTGTDVTLPAATTTNAGLMTAAQQVKLGGIATGATANSSDATLLARANHTGTQAASTISDFSTATDARITAAIGTTVQAYDGDLTAIAALSTNGFAKRTGANTWVIDANTYITGNQTVTLSGDATGSGTTAITVTLANSAVTNAKMADMATATVKGRNTAGTGAPEDVTMSQLRALININFTDVAGTIALAQIPANLITNAKLAQIATARFKGRITASTGDVEELTGTQATSLLDLATSSVKGLIPATGTPSGKYLKDDLTWATPAGGSGRVQDVNNFYYANDFLDMNTGAIGIWQGTGIGSGGSGLNVPNASRTAKHPGVTLLKNGTSANTGYLLRSNNINIVTTPNQEMNFIFNMIATAASGYNTNTVLRMGFMDSSTAAESTDGIVLCKDAGSNDIFGKVISNGSATSTSTLATLAAETWYHGKIKVDSAGTAVTFTVYDEAGTSLGSATISSGLPTGASRLYGTGVALWHSTETTSRDLLYLDFMDIYMPGLARGFV